MKNGIKDKVKEKIKDKIKEFVIDSYGHLNTRSQDDNLYLSLTLGKNDESKGSQGILPLLKISERLKKTFLNEIELRDGLKLMLNDYDLKKGVIIDFNIFNSPLEFVFCLSGRISATISTLEGKTEEVMINKAMNMIFSFPNSKGKIVVTPLEPVRILSLHIAPAFLKEFIDNDFKLLPDEIKNFLTGNINNSFIYEGTITPDMYVAINQIMDCNFKGMARKMYLESKSLELMTLQISQLFEDLKPSRNQPKLTDYDAHQIKKIKNLMIQRLNKPLSLKELSDIAGMSHTKLNSCFKTMYGSTVFEFLRRHRLEFSRYLLNEGKLNITEIVYEAGWSNPSHFSKEFSKHYGINPKSYQKNGM